MNFYQRKLPHCQPDNAEFFVTFRLTGSLPKSVIQETQLEKNYWIGSSLNRLMPKIKTTGRTGQAYAKASADKLSDLHCKWFFS